MKDDNLFLNVKYLKCAYFALYILIKEAIPNVAKGIRKIVSD